MKGASISAREHFLFINPRNWVLESAAIRCTAHFILSLSCSHFTWSKRSPVDNYLTPLSLPQSQHSARSTALVTDSTKALYLSLIMATYLTSLARELHLEIFVLTGNLDDAVNLANTCHYFSTLFAGNKEKIAREIVVS